MNININFNENHSLEELVARCDLCSELLAVIDECNNNGFNSATTLGTLEGCIEIIKNFCEIRIKSELEKMEKEIG